MTELATGGAGTERRDDVNPESASRVLALVGSGGDGVALLGELILRMAAQQGMYGVMVQSYGPQIRGGESAAILRIGPEEVQYEGDAADVLLCFRVRDLNRFQGAVSLHDRSVIILEEADTDALPEWLGASDREIYRFPFANVDEGQVPPNNPPNMLGLALLCRVLGWSPDLARDTMRHRFEKRPEALARNLDAFDRAWAVEDTPRLAPITGSGRSLVIETGNEAVARGAIDAGLRFFAGYPITPSSEIMETLIHELPQAGGRIIQAEDEIAALGMVLGASFGGVPSMTATSGPGLSLMTEMLGLSSMAEIPCIIVDCQRAGPATGMPSRTEQSDLFHAVYAGHGDFPRAVLGTFDVVHAREVMRKALYLSETYQLPVLVLSDAYIAQRRQIRAMPDAFSRAAAPQRRAWTAADGPARFDLHAPQGVNPFPIPGTSGGTYMAAGIEHSEDGTPTADTQLHQRMNEKRFRKLDSIAVESAEWVRTFGRDDAPFGLIAWGSQYGILREWTAMHPEYRVFMPEIIHPFPLAAFSRWREGLEWSAVVELSYQGQFHTYVSSLTDLREVHRLTRSGGTPLNLSELARLIDGARS